MIRPHINAAGEFQSDKYPTCPAGKVPLSVADPTAQPLLWEYAQRRREFDAEFADDLEFALTNAGYVEAPVPVTVGQAQRLSEDELEGALWHACSSGTQTPLMVRDVLMRLVLEAREHRRRMVKDREEIGARLRTCLAAAEEGCARTGEGTEPRGRLVHISRQILDVLAILEPKHEISPVTAKEAAGALDGGGPA